MTIVAVRSFVAVLPDGQRVHVCEGDELVLPPGVDWLKAGLVMEIPDEDELETAAKAAPKEKATKRAPRKKAG